VLLGLAAQEQALMPVTGVQLVPKVWAQVRVVVLGLPRPSGKFSGDCGAVHPDPAGNLGSANPTIHKFFYLDAVIES